MAFTRRARLAAYSIAALMIMVLAHPALGGNASQLLDKMSHAMQTRNYQGTFIYLHNGQLETMSIEHSRDGDVERERLLSLNGEAREVIRDNNSVTCIWPGTRAVTVSKARPRTPFPATLPAAATLAEYYEISALGDTRIAGLPARMLAIDPRDEFRYGYRLWLDRDTHLLLRSDLIDGKGSAIEQVMFTRLEIVDHIPAERFTPVLNGTGYTWKNDEDEPAMSPDLMWKVQQLPPGFELTRRSKKPMMANEKGVEHLVFSDGLATVSVFIEPQGGDVQHLLGPSSMGGVNAFGAVHSDYQITVVGEVPAATVRYIAEAVVYNP